MSHAEIAHLALEHYNLADAKRELLQDQWNTTYCVTVASGQRYNLRICGEAFQDRKCLADELVFVDFVAQRQQVRVPRPMRNVAETFVTVVTTPAEKRLCSLFEWLPGDIARGQLTGPLLQQMGAATALLHQAARAFSFPAQDDNFRNGYNFDEVLVASHREWIAEHRRRIGQEQVTLLHQAIDHVLDHFNHLGKDRDTYGFIHADLHPGNFVVTGDNDSDNIADNIADNIGIIDFDQLGRGHFCFDLAVMMVELFEEGERFTSLWSRFKEGYAEIAALPFTDERALAPFVIAVHLGFLDWVYNTPSEQVRQQWLPKFPQTYAAIRKKLEIC